MARDEPLRRSKRQWRIVGIDEGDSNPECSNWGNDEDAMRKIFAIWMDSTNPPYDEVWMESRTVTYSEPERVDG